MVEVEGLIGLLVRLLTLLLVVEDFVISTAFKRSFSSVAARVRGC